MSGHNKWSKIKHKKEASDAKKSKVFSKIVKYIQVEAKKSGGDINSPGLRLAIEKAKAVNMPADNIERAIKKASEGGADLQPVMFEVYGPGGVGLIITALTDNNNRTSQEMRHILDLQDTALGGVGSVAWNFAKSPEGEWVPNMTTDLSDEDLEKLSELVEAIEDQEDVQDVYTSAE